MLRSVYTHIVMFPDFKFRTSLRISILVLDKKKKNLVHTVSHRYPGQKMQ